MFFRRLVRNLTRSLQWKLVFIFISITLCLMIFVYVALNSAVNSFNYNDFVEKMDKGYTDWCAWSNIKQDSTREDIIINLKDKRNDMYFFHRNDTLNITVIDKKSKSSADAIVYTSDARFNEDNGRIRFLTEILNSVNLLKVKSGEVEKSRNNKLINSTERAYFDYAFSAGNFIYYFTYDKDAWRDLIRQFSDIILSITFMAVMISLIIGYILSKTITGPIVNIMHKAQKVAEGEFDHQLEVRSDDEIGKLTKTFNFMAKELKSTLAEISSEKSKVETILNYMTDGVIAFNIKGEIIHANPAAVKLLDLPDTKTEFNDFSSRLDLGITIEEILYLESSVTREKDFKYNDRYIRSYFAVFTDESKKAEGMIVVLQDVTEQQRLEGMRREFVANVSHELRTPLTSIKSYTETLLDGALEDKETTERFLGVINSEADRMTRLVKDLLQLTRLDNQQMQWKMQETSFESLVKGAIEKMQIEAKNKEQTLESFVIGDIPDIIADRDRIEQVILNILSNAIKYTPSRGKITVYIGKIYSEVYVKVSDTGVGIPEADIPRIFERFYRVDKARSREMGGTGLGLAIAREIVEVHGGSILVSSEQGKGSEFTVRLPVTPNREI